MYNETGIEIHEIEDVYRTLFVAVHFDNVEDYKNFNFNIFFDINMTLDDKYILNVYNRHDVNNETVILRLKTYHNLVDAIAALETLIGDPRYVGKVSYSEVVNVKGRLSRQEDEYNDTINIADDEIAKLRTFRNRLLELASYS